MTQQQLADAAKTTKSHISRVESNKVKAVGQDMLQRIAIALHTELEPLASAAWQYESSSSVNWQSIEQFVTSHPDLDVDRKRAILTVLREFRPK